MKNTVLFNFLLLTIFASCNPEQKKETNLVKKETIKVGIFDKNGDSPYCITDAIEALKIDSAISPRIISAAEIMSGASDDIDVYLFPGGGGRSETGSLGEMGQEKIINLVKEKGKGVVGICAGAYILSNTPNYPCLALSGGQAIDIEHDHRGHGLAKFKLTKKGKEIFPELADREISYSQYYEGPVLIPDSNSGIVYTELATMLSDVHTIEGTPANMTNNRPFIIVSDAGKGKTASVIAHPENTAGMRWMIPRLVRVVAKKGLIPYDQNVVRPDIYSDEILYTKEVRQGQRKAYNSLLGSKEEKLKAMQDIVDMCSWSAKKWIPPMVRDKDFDVRYKAAQLTVYLERTDAIKDLEATIMNEENPNNKAKMQEQYELLKAMVKN